MSFDPAHVLKNAMANIGGQESGISDRRLVEKQLEGIRQFMSTELIGEPAFSEDGLRAVTSSTNEHCVFEDKNRGLAIKLTKPTEYGHSIINGTHSATPFEYLRRLSDHNKHLGGNYSVLHLTDSRQLVVGQKWYDFDASLVTEQDIETCFRNFGFFRSNERPQDYGGGLYFNPNSGIQLVAVDANDKNILRLSSGEIVVLDVVVGPPADSLRARLVAEFNS